MITTYDAVNELEKLITRVVDGSGHTELSSGGRVTAYKICKLINDLKSTKELEVMDIVLLMGNRYEFSDDKNDWEEGELYDYSDEPVQTKQYQSKSGDKTEWYLYIREIKPQPALTYTQAMADDGELPSVGMEYEHGIVLVGADKEGMYVISEHGISIIAELSAIKPIDTRTDKEKLIEEFQSALHDAFGTHTADDWSSIEDIASDLFDSFLIQPLTVEVK